MTVTLFFEWDNPLEDERLSKYHRFSHTSTYWKDLVESGIVSSYSTYADTGNSRHIIGLFEFNDWESLSKVMGSKEFQDGTREFSYLVDNLNYRLLRPTTPL
jgi:hypothetical protein